MYKGQRRGVEKVAYFVSWRCGERWKNKTKQVEEEEEEEEVEKNTKISLSNWRKSWRKKEKRPSLPFRPLINLFYIYDVIFMTSLPC